MSHISDTDIQGLLRGGIMPLRDYSRTWDDIEKMLTLATERRQKWRESFDFAQTMGDKELMKESARNYKALEGVEKTLKWVLGEEGISHPLA